MKQAIGYMMVHAPIVEEEKKFDPNGHEYVDLGLPSGTLWATMNVGANSETDVGLYFQWGDTQGYTDTSTKSFSWSDYKWTEDGGSTMLKYNITDDKTILDLEDDAAYVNWGGSWKMPTVEQCQELLNTDNCTNSWTTVNGVNGRLFTSKTNENTLFIPTAGGAFDGSMNGVGVYGLVWSSSLFSSNVKIGSYLWFSSNVIGVNNSYRYYGYPVRGVIG